MPLLLLLLLLCCGTTALQMPTPSLALQTRINQHVHVQSAQSDALAPDAETQRIKARRKRKPKPRPATDSVQSAVDPAPRQAQGKQRPQQQAYSARGSNPNIYWRAVSMDELRQHPYYVRLPSASELRRVATDFDFQKLRQDSSAWDAVHEGRLTTSSCASVSISTVCLCNKMPCEGYRS
jgi:hypothetical protein